MIYGGATRKIPRKIITKIPPLPVAEGGFLVATLYKVAPKSSHSVSGAIPPEERSLCHIHPKKIEPTN